MLVFRGFFRMVGVAALVLTLALYRLGVRGSALYDGSWAEWGRSDGPPVATGPA